MINFQSPQISAPLPLPFATSHQLNPFLQQSERGWSIHWLLFATGCSRADHDRTKEATSSCVRERNQLVLEQYWARDCYWGVDAVATYKHDSPCTQSLIDTRSQVAVPLAAMLNYCRQSCPTGLSCRAGALQRDHRCTPGGAHLRPACKMLTTSHRRGQVLRLGRLVHAVAVAVSIRTPRL